MTPTTPGGLSGVANGLPNMGALPYLPSASVEFVLKGPDGAPIKGGAVITLFKVASSEAMQLSTKGTSLVFPNVPQTEYRVQVAAPLYRVIEKHIDIQNSRSMKVEITLEPLSAEEQALATAAAALPAKAQKELGKAIDALQSNNLSNVRGHLDALVRIAPNNAEVNYLYGVYASKTNNDKDAVAYWTQALQADPRHIRTLLSLGQVYLEQKRTEEALALAKRAAAADPSSWRAEALLAGVAQQQSLPEDVVTHGERALELGHGQAAIIEPMLAAALARRGQKDRATALLQSYLQDHAGDADVTKELSAIQSGAFAAEPELRSGSAVAEAASKMPIAANWLPPDVDEKMPPAQKTAACSTPDIVANAGRRVQEFASNLDRFTATESLVNHTIDKWGVPGPPVTRNFDYVAAVQEVRPGLFNFDEYRHSPKGDDTYPDGVATNGLPALVMIFHPYYASTFDMNCEGLSSWDGKPVWQIHFRQKPGETKSLRTYKIGIDGPSYAVQLRGRAWIAADTYQIMRLETDLVAPVKQIRLFADHAIIEYAPVAFEKNKLEMWLPHRAEVYFDWRGHRMHRTHSFSKYLLFSVDDRQKISAPPGSGGQTIEVNTHVTATGTAASPAEPQPSLVTTIHMVSDTSPLLSNGVDGQAKGKRAVSNFLHTVQHRIMSAAEAMPAERYHLAAAAPGTGDSRSFAEYLKDLAQSNRRLALQVAGQTPAATGDPVAGMLHSKDEILEYLKESFVELGAAIDAAGQPTVSAANASAPNSGNENTALTRASEALVAMFDDYDRLLEYFKANDVPPPNPQ